MKKKSFELHAFSRIDYMTDFSSVSGLLLLDKPENITSQGAVSRVRRLLNIKTAGHTGTLDPMATGVLPILIGRAVKASEFLLEGDKHYDATLRLGLTTDTEDITGRILTETDTLPNEAAVFDVAASFLGESLQIPPMYSAIRVGGRRLMELARQGMTVEREARKIRVDRLDVLKLSDSDYRLSVSCSKGTYIRTLCADIGQKLGCGGTMAALRRTEAASFKIGACHTLEELEGMTVEERIACLIPTEELFPHAEKLTLPAFYARLAHNGQQIYLSKIRKDFPLASRIRLYDGERFFALGEVQDFEDGRAIKPIKQF